MKDVPRNNYGFLNIQTSSFHVVWNRDCTQSLVVNCKYNVLSNSPSIQYSFRLYLGHPIELVQNKVSRDWLTFTILITITRIDGVYIETEPSTLCTWWRHQMETFSALLALCAGNSPVPVNSPHKGQWRGALMFSFICAWINNGVNNREAGDLRRHRGHYDVNVMEK